MGESQNKHTPCLLVTTGWFDACCPKISAMRFFLNSGAFFLAQCLADLWRNGFYPLVSTWLGNPENGIHRGKEKSVGFTIVMLVMIVYQIVVI